MLKGGLRKGQCCKGGARRGRDCKERRGEGGKGGGSVMKEGAALQRRGKEGGNIAKEEAALQRRRHCKGGGDVARRGEEGAALQRRGQCCEGGSAEEEVVLQRRGRR